MGPCAAAAAGDTRQTEVPCVSFSWDQAGGKWMKQIFKLQIDMGWLEILFLLKRMFVACFFAWMVLEVFIGIWILGLLEDVLFSDKGFVSNISRS